MVSEPFVDEEKYMENLKKAGQVESLLRRDITSKSTTESSVTTVVSTLSKSSDEHKSILEDATSADFSKISGADLVKDPSKTSMEAKEDSRFEELIEDRVTPDLSKKSLDLTKDYSKSSIDSKDTSRDFATNELSKDSTVDLTKDYSKASIESVKEISRSIDEKTYSEEHSSLDLSKTLASEASEGITTSKDFIDEDKSVSKQVLVSTGSSQETSILTESKIFSEHDDKLKSTEKLEQEKDIIDEMEEKIEELKSEFKKEAISLEKEIGVAKETIVSATTRSVTTTQVSHKEVSKIPVAIKQKTPETTEKKVEETDKETEDLEKEDEVPDMSELNRRCSNLLEDISQGALIRIDSTHVTQGMFILFDECTKYALGFADFGKNLFNDI